MKKEIPFPQSRIEALLKEETGIAGPFRWHSLKSDGSARAFYRVQGQRDTLVLIWSPLEDETFPNENDSYVYMGRHLEQKGIPVPRIYAYWRTEGLILAEDLGSVHLQDAVRSDRRKLAGFYQQAAELLLNIQVRATEGLDTNYCFDTPVYNQSFIMERELEYFHQSFLLGALGVEVGWELLEQEFLLLALRAGGEKGRLFFLHRDFQSRNMMVKDELLHVIDFQGARLGPPQYDLAALLLDPYVDRPELLQQEMLIRHSRRLGEATGVSVTDFLEIYPHVALCRNLQMLAAYAFLSRIRGRAHFARYIMPAWKNLRRLLAQPPCSDYDGLARLVMAQSDEAITGAAARCAGLNLEKPELEAK